MGNVLLLILLLSLTIVWLRALVKRDYPVTPEEKRESDFAGGVHVDKET